MLFVDMIL